MMTVKETHNKILRCEKIMTNEQASLKAVESLKVLKNSLTFKDYCPNPYQVGLCIDSIIYMLEHPEKHMDDGNVVYCVSNGN